MPSVVVTVVDGDVEDVVGDTGVVAPPAAVVDVVARVGGTGAVVEGDATGVLAGAEEIAGGTVVGSALLGTGTTGGAGGVGGSVVGGSVVGGSVVGGRVVAGAGAGAGVVVGASVVVGRVGPMLVAITALGEKEGCPVVPAELAAPYAQASTLPG